MASHPGHDFWRSWWCDLFGSPDPVAAAFSRLGLAGFALAALPFWVELPRFLPAARRSASVARALGIAAFLGLGVVARTAGGTREHGLAILAACAPALPAILLVIRCQALRHQTRPAAWLGAAMLLVSSANFVQYVREQWLGAPEWAGLPAGQKVATLLIVVWVGASLRTE